ncbi:MAG: hypothetical protein KDK90_27790 [Leptospiraceae bacterium]|nr:hypothetical protein [Leptospiraceae bacterium]
MKFESGVREARLYRLPDGLIKWDGINVLELKVYDYSSIGGFCYNQKPVIGKYEYLHQKKRNQLILNNLPRVLIFSITLLLIGYMIQYCSYIFFKNKFKEIMYFFWTPLNIIALFSKNENIKYNFEVETAIRYLYGIILFIVCSFFISSEFTFKYHVIGLSEEFWFKYPPVSFQIGQMFLLCIIHPDVFGRHVELKLNFQTIAAITTHPIVSFLVFLYLLFLRPEDAWNQFSITAIFVNTWIMTIIFGYSGIQLLRARKIVESHLVKAITQHGFLRIWLIFFAFTIYSFSLYFPNPSIRFQIRENIFLFTAIILYILSIFSIYFSQKYEIRLPLKLEKKKKLFSIYAILQNEFKLTYQESDIANLLLQGFDRSKIINKKKITEQTLKNQLRSIYSKTIDKEIEENIENKSKNRRKLSRLISFLHDLEKKTNQGN